MRIKVQYDGKDYGAGSNATKYKLTISQESPKADVKILFDFDKPTSGQSNSWDSYASVMGGTIILPKRQAVEVAIALLSFCRQSEHQSKTAQSAVITLDENDLESRCVPAIRCFELANLLQVKVEEVIKEAQKLNFQPATRTTFLPLTIAQSISQQLSKESLAA